MIFSYHSYNSHYFVSHNDGLNDQIIKCVSKGKYNFCFNYGEWFILSVVVIKSGFRCILKTILISRQLMNFTLISSQSWLKKTFLTHFQNNLDFKKTWVFHNVSFASSEESVNIILFNDGGVDSFFSNQRIPLGGHSVPGGTIQASGRTTLATERIWVSENDDGSDCNPTPVVPAPLRACPFKAWIFGLL